VLNEFLMDNRGELIDRCRSKVAKRTALKANHGELDYGIPLFLDQLIATLRKECASEPDLGSGVESDPPHLSGIGTGAMLHGRELLERGFTIDQVVHDYGDLCQAITGLAVECGVPIDANEFKTLNRCLDDGIADAVTEFSHMQNALLMDRGIQASNERLGVLAHELRNRLQTAMLAVTALKSGNVGLNGATGALLDRSLIGLSNLIDGSLSEVRAAAGIPPRHQLILMTAFIAEVKISASLEAGSRGCTLTVSDVDKSLAVFADRDLLFSAIGNLLQNAFKFTQPGTEVSLTIHAVGGRLLIDVTDHCGGLPPGAAAKLFEPFTQRGVDRSGLGLGLSIARRSVEASGGTLSVRDMPGSGCVFTIDLPRQVVP
jgi:signal transduction histidine kinase